jgi:lysophospholipase L1-like esterase
MRQRAKLWASLAILVVPPVAVELGYRVSLRADERAELASFRDYLLTGRIQSFEERAYTNYQRPRASPSSNEFGFQDLAWERARTPGVPRVVCLGSSTTEGGNPAGLFGSYPYLLEDILESRVGRDFEVLNAGISSWTTAEELASWFLTLSDFAPDVLVLHEAAADLEPRFLANFEPDYSHWRRPLSAQPVGGFERLLVRASDLYLHLERRAGGIPDIISLTTDRSAPPDPWMSQGKLDPKTALPFRRNVLQIARAATGERCRVVLMTLPTGPAPIVGDFWRYGIAEHNQHLRDLCTEHGFVLVDAAQAFESRPELARHFLDLVHLDPDGNRAKAECVADALTDWLEGLPREGARPPVPRRH